MPLRSPKRLPKNLRRPTSAYSKALARKYYGGGERASRKRKEMLARWSRKAARMSSVVLSEFRMWMMIGAGLVVLAVAVILLFAPFFDVREMQIRRQDPRIDPEEIQQTLSPLFRQRLVLVSRGQVEAMLRAEYPDIDRVEISKEYPSTLEVTVFLEPVVAEVRIDDSGDPATGTGAVAAASGTTFYSYVTDEGYFVTSPIKLGDSPLPVLTITDWNIRPQNRMRLLSPTFLETVFLARDTLRRDFGLNTTSMVLYAKAQEFHIRTNKVALWFDLRSPLPLQFQRFRQFLKAVSIDQAKEYVDLRIADKIIYK